MSLHADGDKKLSFSKTARRYTLYHLKMLFRIQVHQNLIDITLNMRLRGVAETYHDENCHISDKISSLRFLCTNLKKFVCVMN